MENSECSKS